jgi:glucose-fructose oxidoreductase
MNYLQVNYEKGWLKMEPHSSYKNNKGSMSDGTIIDYAIASQQAKQMDEDVISILKKEDMIVPGEEGLRDITVVEGIYKSAAEKCEVKL